jgi:MFS family permease
LEIPLLRWLWLAGSLLAVFAAGVTTDALYPALPVIASQVNHGPSHLGWIAAGQALTFAGLVVFGAVAGDLLGHVRVYLAGVAVFVAASALAAVADSVTLLEVARFGQGAGAGLLLPQAVGYARTHLRRVERGPLYALFALAFVSGPPIGQLIGAIGVDRASSGWRVVLWLAVALGVLAGGLALPMLGERVPLRFDPLAPIVALLGAGGAFLIMYALIDSAGSGLSVLDTVLLVVGTLVFLGCLLADVLRRGIRPGLGAPIVALLAATGAASMPALVWYVQVAAGWTILQINLLALPYAIGAVVGAVAAGLSLTLGLDRRLVVAVGAVVLVLGTVLQLLFLDVLKDRLIIWYLSPSEALFGLGLTLVVGAIVSTNPGQDGRDGRPVGVGQSADAGPGPVFAGLLFGSAIGGTLLDLFIGGGLDSLQGEEISQRLGDRLLHAANAMLVSSLVMLVAAAVVAWLLSPRGPLTDRSPSTNAQSSTLYKG